MTMPDFNRLQEDLASLPEGVQQTIIDFVGFLKQKHQPTEQSPPSPISFDDQPFVGMWSDRPEMKDSVAWVRKLRTQQWQK